MIYGIFETYSCFLRFSVTKWVHLNGGDTGLRKFFERVHSVLRPNGVFILEPQEWETYAKAKRIDTVRTCQSAHLGGLPTSVGLETERNCERPPTAPK